MNANDLNPLFSADLGSFFPKTPDCHCDDLSGEMQSELDPSLLEEQEGMEY